jgi:F-type H+-transporting ATPase subunit b
MGALFATFGINVNLLVIQAVNFGITLVVLWWFLYRPLIKIIEERKAKIAKGIDDAAAAAASRAATDAEKSGIISKAEKEAEAVVNRAAEEGKKERAAIVKAAQERAEVTLRDAEAQSAEARRQALKDSDKEIVQTAILAAEKILATK